MRLNCVASVLAFLVVLGSCATATMIQIEPDDFAANADISEVIPGASLSTVGPRAGDGRVYAVPARASTGSLVFGNQMDDNLWYGGAGSSLRIDFAVPASAVSMDLVMNDISNPFHYDPWLGHVWAFDSGGNQVGAVELDLNEYPPSYIASAEIVRPDCDIAYIIASGNGGVTVNLDNFQADVLPEPCGTAFLLMSGAAVLRLRRRRARCI